jgi:hypothetical protein
LVALEAGVFLQTEDRAISEDGLVENLRRGKSQSLSIWGYGDIGIVCKLTCRK